MTQVSNLKAMAHRKLLAEAKQQQHQMGMHDGLSDFEITAGAWVDGTSAGLSPKAIAQCFFQSSDALDFEARVWAERKWHGLGENKNADAIRYVLENGALPPANDDNAPTT